jgi:DNA-binding CsgD family transcriptional regulator
LVHFSIVTLVLAFVAGAIAIALSATSYKQFRSAHIIPHIYLVGSVNAIILVNVSTLYFYQNLSTGSSVTAVSAVDNAYQILMPALQILAVCSLMQLSQMLLGSRSRRCRPARYLALAAGALTLQIVFAYLRLDIVDLPIIYLSYRFIEATALVAAYLILGMLVLKAGSARPVARRRAIRMYALMLGGALTLAILTVALSWLRWIPPDIYTVLLAVVVLVANLIPILYYQRLLLPRFEQLDRVTSADQASFSLGETFNISAREREVLDLVCKGHTNKEISDMLFISLQTVKDHVSRIYRKIGVKNRIQLMAKLGDRSEIQNSDRPE